MTDPAPAARPLAQAQRGSTQRGRGTTPGLRTSAENARGRGAPNRGAGPNSPGAIRTAGPDENTRGRGAPNRGGPNRGAGPNSPGPNRVGAPTNVRGRGAPNRGVAPNSPARNRVAPERPGLPRSGSSGMIAGPNQRGDVPSRNGLNLSDGSRQQKGGVRPLPAAELPQASVGVDYLINNNIKKPEKKVDNTKRKHMISEFLSTENTYVEMLTTACSLMEILVKDKDYNFTKEDAHLVFSNLDIILKRNSQLYNNLSKRMAENETNPDDAQLFDILLDICNHTDFEKVYQTYINGYEKSLEKLNEKLKDKEIKKFVNAQLRKRKGFPSELSSYLITPVQRLPRYIMLLTGLKQCTSDSHPDYENICQAETAFEKITRAVDNGKEMYEMMLRKEILFSDFSPEDKENVLELQAPDANLIFEAPLLQRQPNSSEFELRYIIVLKTHIIGTVKRESSDEKKKEPLFGLKFLWKIEVLSANVVFYPPTDDATGEIAICLIRRLTQVPFISHEMFWFAPFKDGRYKWRFWQKKLTDLFKITADTWCLSQRAATTKEHLQQHIITEKDWKFLTIGTKEIVFPHVGGELLSQGDTVEALYYVQKGSLFVVKNISEGASHTIATVRERHFVGEIAFLGKKNHAGSYASASLITAEEDVVVYRLEHAKLESLLRNNAELGWRFYFLLCAEFSYRILRLDALQSVGGNFIDINRLTHTHSSPAITRLSRSSSEAVNLAARGSSKENSTKKYQSIQKLLKSEKILMEFTCKFKVDSGSMNSGSLFVSQSSVCLYRKVFGKKTLILIVGSSIVSVTKVDSLKLTFTFVKESKESKEGKESIQEVKVAFKSESEYNDCYASLKQFVTTSDTAPIEIVRRTTKEDTRDSKDLFSTETQFKNGDIILFQGNLTNDVYQIMNGTCKVIIDEREITTLVEGQIFGELSFLLGTVVSATVIVTSPVATLASCSWEALSNVAATKPIQAAQFYCFLARTLCRRFLATEQNLITKK